MECRRIGTIFCYSANLLRQVIPYNPDNPVILKIMVKTNNFAPIFTFQSD
jgi:hypothetical protein